MPITKKKGAIFAIYADSPSRPISNDPSGKRATRSSKGPLNVSDENAAAPRSTISKPRGPVSESNTSTGKPITKTSRRALSSIQPTSIPPLTSASATNKHSPVVFVKQPSLKSPSHTNVAKPGITAASSKRQHDVTSSPAPSPTIPQHCTHTSTCISLPQTNLIRTPAKRPKSLATPRKPLVQDSSDNKENLSQSVIDSPASRTRSKTRLEESPDASTITGIEMSPNTAQEMAILIGDGRGTLTLKKGRTVAKLMGESMKKYNRSVMADGVLSDVSEAYGASGKEPEGFKTQRS